MRISRFPSPPSLILFLMVLRLHSSLLEVLQVYTDFIERFDY